MQRDPGQTLALLDHAVIIILHTIIQTHAAQILTVVERITPKRVDRRRQLHTEKILPPRKSALADASHRKCIDDCRNG